MAIFIFLLGISSGSFLNCLVWRLNHGLSPIKGRSICPKCKRQLAWYDNIPLLSFFLLRGKCRWCHSPISIQYPLVELATGILFVMVTRVTRDTLHVTRLDDFWLVTCYLLLVTACFIAIFVSDLLYMTIPDQIVFSGIILGFGWSMVNGQWLMVLSGLGAALFFFFLAFLTRFKGMGLGDVKLAGLMGLILGWPKILVAFYFAFLTGAAVGVILILLGKKHFGQHIPFGPFLTTATFISIFWGDKIYQWGGKFLGLL